MTKTIAIAALKGGVGKSTLATNLAKWLHDNGRSVLLIDLDPQGTALDWATTAADNEVDTPTVTRLDAKNARLSRQIRDLAQGRDFVVVDTPPRLAKESRAAVISADVVILPLTPSGADLWGLGETVEMVLEAQETRPEIKAVVVMNRVQSRRSISEEVRQVVSDLPFPKMDAELGDRAPYVEGLASGRCGADFSDAKARGEVDAFCTEVLALLGGK